MLIGHGMTSQAPKLWPERLQQLFQLLKPPRPNPALQLQRIKAVERDILLPVRAAFVAAMGYYLFVSPWILSEFNLNDVAQGFIQTLFVAYVGANLVVAYALLAMRRFSLPALQWVLVISGLLDALMFAALTYITNGFQSILYWVFPLLIVRNAISLPLASQQISLNFIISLLYLSAGLLQIALAETDNAAELVPISAVQPSVVTNALLAIHQDPRTLASLRMAPADYQTEPFLLRVAVLFLLSLVCYGLQILFEKQRVADEEAREVAARQAQLDAAGRLSAEIAHQLKNPLSIINNAAFNLQRLLKSEPAVVLSQVQIIREEIERSDRIITDLMGYAKLADARVEKLDVVEELDRALGQVFPPGVATELKIERNFDRDLPCLMMQRGHLAEALVNILQNSRDATGGKGSLKLTAKLSHEQVLITIEDDGPGIAPERLEQIFEVYYTTKPKGTGLGLAIARQSLDIYQGKVRAESELGKGARFILSLPVKSLTKHAG